MRGARKRTFRFFSSFALGLHILQCQSTWFIWLLCSLFFPYPSESMACCFLADCKVSLLSRAKRAKRWCKRYLLVISTAYLKNLSQLTRFTIGCSALSFLDICGLVSAALSTFYNTAYGMLGSFTALYLIEISFCTLIIITLYSKQATSRSKHVLFVSMFLNCFFRLILLRECFSLKYLVSFSCFLFFLAIFYLPFALFV